MWCDREARGLACFRFSDACEEKIERSDNVITLRFGGTHGHTQILTGDGRELLGNKEILTVQNRQGRMKPRRSAVLIEAHERRHDHAWQRANAVVLEDKKKRIF